MRGPDELAGVDDPAWPLIAGEIAGAAVPVSVLPPDDALGRATLHQLQVTARSYLGAVALHCGGLLVDGGWLRVYGSPVAGHPAAPPALARVNGFPPEFDPSWRPDAGLVVAHDVLGGVFALNSVDPGGAGRPGEPGEVVYFGPDSLRWEALGAGHSAWLSWVLSGGLAELSAPLRWPGWREEVAGLTGRQGLSFFPPLWSAEGRRDLSDRAATGRRPVPLAELLSLGRDTCRQFGDGDPGFLGAV